MHRAPPPAAPSPPAWLRRAVSAPRLHCQWWRKARVGYLEKLPAKYQYSVCSLLMRAVRSLSGTGRGAKTGAARSGKHV